jgi:hypothetical protein
MARGEYQVRDGGGVARICLVADAHRLLPAITAARRLGLSGVVADSTYRRLAHAEVTVVATRAPLLTDSSGEFFIPLKPGTLHG